MATKRKRDPATALARDHGYTAVDDYDIRTCILPHLRDPQSRARLVAEHRAHPRGAASQPGVKPPVHSEPLKRLIDRSRVTPQAGRHTIVETVPRKEPVEDTSSSARYRSQAGAPRANDCPLLLAASTQQTHSGRHVGGAHFKHLASPWEIPVHTRKYNGKIERPKLANRALSATEVELLLASAGVEDDSAYADLAKVLYRLNGSRPGPVRGFYVIVGVEPGRFAVGQLCADPAVPVQLFEDLIFASEGEARARAEALRASGRTPVSR